MLINDNIKRLNRPTRLDSLGSKTHYSNSPLISALYVQKAYQSTIFSIHYRLGLLPNKNPLAAHDMCVSSFLRLGVCHYIYLRSIKLHSSSAIKQYQAKNMKKRIKRNHQPYLNKKSNFNMKSGSLQEVCVAYSAPLANYW